MTDLTALIERVESGTGADRELDCLIWAALDGRTIREDGQMILARNSRPPHDEYIVGWVDPGKVQRNFSEGHSIPPVRRYTTSLDAVLSLIEAKLPGMSWEVRRSGFGTPSQAMIWDPMKSPPSSTIARISVETFFARALLAAALSAIQESRNDR